AALDDKTGRSTVPGPGCQGRSQPWPGSARAVRAVVRCGALRTHHQTLSAKKSLSCCADAAPRPSSACPRRCERATRNSVLSLSARPGQESDGLAGLARRSGEPGREPACRLQDSADASYPQEEFPMTTNANTNGKVRKSLAEQID